jgi:hypothetical protein
VVEPVEFLFSLQPATTAVKMIMAMRRNMVKSFDHCRKKIMPLL